MDERKIDEILEYIWTARESGATVTEEGLLGFSEVKVSKEDIEALADHSLIEVKSGTIMLAKNAEARAARIMRCHRLAERLLVDVLGMKTTFEPVACGFEHNLSYDIADAICTLLGHPKECPHGRPIPQGECCRKAERELGSVILPLGKLRAGERAVVMYVTTAHHSRLDRLVSLGVKPHTELVVHQTSPSFVVTVEHVQIALDDDVVKDIYVRQLSRRR